MPAFTGMTVDRQLTSEQKYEYQKLLLFPQMFGPNDSRDEHRKSI